MWRSLRYFSTKPKLPFKLGYNEKGEYTVLSCPGLQNYIRLSCIGISGYIYFIYCLSPDTKLGDFKKYTLPVFMLGGAVAVHRLSKLLHKVVLLEGGQFIRIEKYPMLGFGHKVRHVLPIECVQGVVPYGRKKWYNPFRFGRGIYKMVYERKLLGRMVYDKAIFKLPNDYDKNVFKLVAVGKPVNQRTLASISKQ